MRIGLLCATLSIPASRSLKDKRSVVRGLKDRVLNRMNMSVAETGDLDHWRLATLSFVTVAATSEIVQKRFSELDRLLHGDPRFNLLRIETEFL